MDTFKKVIYEQNKQFLDIISKDFCDDNDENKKKEFIENYHKVNFAYMIPTHNDVQNLYKKRVKKIMK